VVVVVVVVVVMVVLMVRRLCFTCIWGAVTRKRDVSGELRILLAFQRNESFNKYFCDISPSTIQEVP
jgi:hypothetical protein